MQHPEPLGAITSFLSKLAHLIEEFDPNWLEGPIQFTLTSPIRAQWHILPSGGTVRLMEGAHANPTWGLEAPLDAFVKIAQNQFSFRDPKSLATIKISGDAFSLHHKLNPFLVPDQAAFLARVFRKRQLAAARLDLSSLKEIRRVPELSEHEVERAAEELTPVIFERGLSTWPVWKWSFAALAERCKEVPFMNVSEYKETTLGAFIERVANGTAAETATAGLELPKELARDLPRNTFLGFATGAPAMWLGPKGYVTLLHRDRGDVLNLQVLGRKHWRLYSPDQAELLYLGPPVEGYQPSQVNVRQPDLQRHPSFSRARCLEFTMEPGNILVNPGGWFHEIDALDPAFSVSMPLTYHDRMPARVASPARN